MKKTVTLLLILFSFMSVHAKKSEVDSILTELDKAIENDQAYIEERQQTIREVKGMLTNPTLTKEQLYVINRELFYKYRSFKSDSAIVYTKKNIEICRELGQEEWLYDALLNLSTLYAIKVMFVEASDILRSIPVNELSEEFRIRYFDAYKRFYDYYSPESEYYQQDYETYIDTLMALYPPDSRANVMLMNEKMIARGEYDKALKILEDELAMVTKDGSWKAILAYSIGEIYRFKDDYEMQKKYFGISALSDITNTVKENASFNALAIACYESGDIDRAYRYIQQSIEDAIFSNSNLRVMEISKIFPIIENSYQHKMQVQQNRLYLLLICAFLLTLSLGIAVIYVNRHIKKLKKARISISDANSRLNELNSDLQKTNEQITEINSQLSESNILKEEYIARYMNQSSNYLDKMDEYRKALNRIAANGKMEDLIRALKSNQFMEDELEEFYNNFDNSFLQLFPNFIDDFNDLLQEGEKIFPKQDELLNTELRIYALIRLGITDSVKISQFLRYSVKTIYNYRTKIRNKAAGNRDEFEDNVMKTGII